MTILEGSIMIHTLQMRKLRLKDAVFYKWFQCPYEKPCGSVPKIMKFLIFLSHSFFYILLLRDRVSVPLTHN